VDRPSWEVYLAEGSKNVMKASFEIMETDGEGLLLSNPCTYGNIGRRRRRRHGDGRSRYC
jgi:hypothetical protein